MLMIIYVLFVILWFFCLAGWFSTLFVKKYKNINANMYWIFGLCACALMMNIISDFIN